MTTTREVWDEVVAERERQDVKWGGPRHDDGHAVIDWADFISQRTADIALCRTNERRAFVEIAALAVAAIESMDRTHARKAAGTSR